MVSDQEQSLTQWNVYCSSSLQRRNFNLVIIRLYTLLQSTKYKRALWFVLYLRVIRDVFERCDNVTGACRDACAVLGVFDS